MHISNRSLSSVHKFAGAEACLLQDVGADELKLRATLGLLRPVGSRQQARSGGRHPPLHYGHESSAALCNMPLSTPRSMCGIQTPNQTDRGLYLGPIASVPHFMKNPAGMHITIRSSCTPGRCSAAGGAA